MGHPLLEVKARPLLRYREEVEEVILGDSKSGYWMNLLWVAGMEAANLETPLIGVYQHTHSSTIESLLKTVQILGVVDDLVFVQVHCLHSSPWSLVLQV